MATAAQIAANQQNSQLSTGPTSPDGKAKTSRNALKTGLTGRSVLLPNEDAELYEQHLKAFVKLYAPVGDQETELVQSIADSAWRLARIPSLEAGIYAIGRIKFANLYPNEDQATRKQMIETETFLAYRRELNNLSTQEGRLRRQREKDEATLQQIQKDRGSRLYRAASAYIDAFRAKTLSEFDIAKFGFEFTLAQIEQKAAEVNPDVRKYFKMKAAEQSQKAA
jgi:hypothetical protein